MNPQKYTLSPLFVVDPLDRMVVGAGFEPANRLPEQIYSLRALAACISHRFPKEREEQKATAWLCQGKIEGIGIFFVMADTCVNGLSG